MFATDNTRIFYPTAPNRVFSIRFADLAAWDGDDHSVETYTDVGSLSVMLSMPDLAPMYDRPTLAPAAFEHAMGCLNPGRIMDPFEDADDFADALEMWADWCDRQSEALDAEDGLVPGVKDGTERAALEAMSKAQLIAWALSQAKVIAEQLETISDLVARVNDKSA